ALKKIFIYDSERGENVDIGDDSKLVQALKQENFYRVYVSDQAQKKHVKSLWEELSQKQSYSELKTLS
ncbi:MAG: hypothetical protein KDK61_05880, partial [Simkania sp.]|nr:hypothetical protein [Simkania sp.]